MGAIFSTILITAPLAFMIGWLVSKAVFRHHSVVRPRGVVTAAETPQAAAQRQKPDIPGRSNDQQIALLEQKLERVQADKRRAMNEVQLLKEAVAEREQRMADLDEQLKLAYLPPEDTAANAADLQNVKHSKDLRDLQTRVENSNRELSGLRHELIAAEKRLDNAKARFGKWRDKALPVVRQFRQQKMIISELREEMRQRELQRDAERPAAKVMNPPPVAPPVQPPVQPAEMRDNLEQLRGVGPALHAKLNDKAIYRLEQLAALTVADMQLFGRSLGISERQIEKLNWAEQAQQLLGRANPTVTDPVQNLIA